MVTGPAEPFDEEHEALRAQVRRFVDDEVAPAVADWETAGWLPDEVFRRCGELGFLGLTLSVADGGQGGDAWAALVLAEELGRSGAGGVGLCLGAHGELALPLMAELASGAQRDDLLGPAVTGERIWCLADGFRLRRAGSSWILDGAGSDVVNGVRADGCLAVAQHEDGASSVLCVETSALAVTRVPTVGMHAADLADVRADGVEVAHTQVLGDPGYGELPWRRAVSRSRLAACAHALGAAQLTFEQTVAYARQREVFGRPVASYQVQRHRLADMATRIEASRRLLYRTWDEWVAGSTHVDSCVLAVATMGEWVADEALQVHGGYGYSTEFSVERAWRDARWQRLADRDTRP